VRWPVDAVLLCANPGVRRGRDNGLAALRPALVTRHLPPRGWSIPAAPRSTPTPNGADVDEDGALEASDSATALLTIERAVLAHPRALVLAAPRWSGRRARTPWSVCVRARAWSRAALDRPFRLPA